MITGVSEGEKIENRAEKNVFKDIMVEKINLKIQKSQQTPSR